MADKVPDQIPTKAIVYTGDIRQNYLGHIMAEIFKDRVYAPILEGRKDLTILDIGAHIGIFSIYASPFAKRIHSVEPSLEHFTSLTQNIQTNQLPNVTPYQYAISNENKMVEFYHNNNKTMYSMRQEVADKSLGVEKVESVTLEKFMNDNNIEHVDFMKLDIEGMEYEVLGGDAFERVSDRIDSLLVESHTWSGRNPHQLIESLKNNNYKVKQMPSDATLLIATR